MSDSDIFYHERKGWGYRYKSGSHFGFKSKLEAAKAYARAVQADPKYAEMLKGKTWSEIFKTLGITI